MMQIAYIKDHQETLPVVAQWLFDQWWDLCPGSTVETFKKHLQENCRDNQVPLTLIALLDGDVVGTASLIEYDMDTRRDLSPWLASVYVIPAQRGKGIGTELVQAIVAKAKEFKIPKLYLFTPDKEHFYQRLGWQTQEHTEYRGHKVVIMCKNP
ncbi:acetyltransferase, GNAT family [Candidatus Vecturithrix granuli]|uniref:Acetyltransferase, GNAT family n=1 Tax=Vecturithrix granuli TaxID=1499967 RepID=A0A0S6WCU4_VECG1|nr:acetyltransferase, GNAT family [Candidatus Vecturithrix granuli]